MKNEYKLLIPTPVGNAMKIGNRIYALVAFCLGLLAMVSSIGIWQMHKLSVEIESIVEENIPLNDILTKITINQLEQSINFERAFRTGEVMKNHSIFTDEFAKSVRMFTDLNNKIEQEFGLVKETILRTNHHKSGIRHDYDNTSRVEEGQDYHDMLEMLRKLEVEHKDYNLLAIQAFRLISQDNLEQAFALLPAIESEKEDINKQLKIMLTHVGSITTSAVYLLRKDTPFALKLLVLLTNIALIIGISTAIFMVRRRISLPLREIVSGIDALSSGDMSVDVKIHNNDEIGAVARSYEIFKHSQIKLKQREQELEASQQRFKDIAEISSDWIWESDKYLRFIFLSQRFAQVAGVPKERLLGTTLSDFSKHAITDSEFYLDDLAAKKSFRDFSCSVIDDSGETRYWIISGRPVFDANGEFKGFRGTGSDRTQQVRIQAELVRHRDHLQELVDNATKEIKVQAAELLEALAKEKKLNKLQSEFVSMASHEFRTPLAIIDTTAQRMKSRAGKNQLTPEDALRRIEKIRNAVQRMTRLMDSTLNAARMQEGKIDINIEPCDIGKVVQDVCMRQQEVAQSHTIICELADLPGAIQADLGSLDQIFTNLLSNAVKYAPDAPEIHVQVRSEGDQVAISVRDHGIGIDEDELNKIGERFFRAKTSTGIAGTGIGLNLVKTLVEMHGGSISIESKCGEGSTFTVRLPVAGPTQGRQDGKVGQAA